MAESATRRRMRRMRNVMPDDDNKRINRSNVKKTFYSS